MKSSLITMGGRFIKTIYNIKRLHSSLGYCSLDKFEDLFYSLKAV
ncbi:MAG: hypothetical protein ABSD46_12335 [Bacteroidota bacterium]